MAYALGVRAVQVGRELEDLTVTTGSSIDVQNGVSRLVGGACGWFGSEGSESFSLKLKGYGDFQGLTKACLELHSIPFDC